MPYSKEEIEELDKVARKLMSGGALKSLTFHMSSGLIIDITKEKYLHTLRAGQNPIEQIFNITANAAAISSLSLSQNFQNVIHYLEASNLELRKLSTAKSKLNKLETELEKQSPNERTIKKLLNWVSNFSFELFLRLSVILAERFLKPM